MKFSVLLPTRNRLEYLRYAVESVRRQDDDDWEIVVSDNCSTDDVLGYVAALGDPRIRAVRTSEPVPVTDNWNNALAHSRGDYVVMLGDDDALMPGYFTTMRAIIERFREPDFLYTGALLFAYPGVLPDAPQGYLQAYGYAAFLRGAREPFAIAPERARVLAQESLHFRIRFGFNAQFSCVSRRLIERIGQPFYRSPFPDYFATNAMFLRADLIVAVPLALVLIGITKKSYGFFHYNGQEEAAVSFLGSRPDPVAADRLRRVLLPGSNINNGWLFAMEALRMAYGVDVDYRRYRHVQVMYALRERYVGRTVTAEQLAELKQHLTRRERLLYGAVERLAYREGRRVAAAGKRAVERLWRVLAPHYAGGPTTFMPWFAEKIEGRYADALDVFEHVDPSDPRWQA